MKVLLPVKDDTTRRNEVAEGFHNLGHVCIHDTDLKTTEWISAKEISETPGGLNSGLLEKNIFSIISMNITPMVLSMFNRNGINVFKARSFDVEKNIRLFQASELKSFTTEESRLISSSSCNSNSCSSCGSTCN
ncbi:MULTISPECIES: NifB/NifX family molybdenum-iron cluster-binding protein [Maribellus]|uniref:Dinitrogenase iron-molybdenum cofactor biosynthesis domain-containing protein n=1 Tax=Maribellus comscasis TaxID=2681766 RepID=A0A6I6JSC4_9BACT|nr:MULTISPECIES: hypothetical protein [Maribellus]MCG6185766.1 hypothetical protein [Maribellus maritimus]QGY43027.1 hypothetical protein GM418_04945 [Maribellus comscasis]